MPLLICPRQSAPKPLYRFPPRVVVLSRVRLRATGHPLGWGRPWAAPIPALGGPGCLLDPDALCDPWAGPLILGHFSPIGEFTPGVVDRLPVANAALGWYCTVFSACCTAVAARGAAGDAAAADFRYTHTGPAALGRVHTKLQQLLDEVRQQPRVVPLVLHQGELHVRAHAAQVAWLVDRGAPRGGRARAVCAAR